ncbi:right-handed parallel beta-helix repeat-containing protein [Methanobrevibacter sp.]|uniref:right-handed parallel beta-helix repeat-containing protein n=1 Tax=Methanobrevibacter sp. TaxID=66852 RepID=UPI0026125AE9|nr:right-handed parallel beta-helix repeat-containing protein [uncultured Methanobrevibacter sp.]
MLNIFNNKKLSLILLVVLFCFFILASTSSAFASEVNINNTTSDGIKGSLGNDTINLEGGIYGGDNNTNISFDNSRNLTIQSADPNNKAIIDLGEGEGITFINNTGDVDSLGSLTLKNLVIKNARFFALLCFNSKLTVINCTFIHNNALLYGLIDMGYHSRLTIIDSDFINNTGRYGTAIATGPSTKGLNITNCNFINNKASESGGALFIFSSEFNNTIIANCNFINNTALNGGAIYNFEGEKNITNCTFINNTASSLGGAIYNENNVYNNIKNCTFINNTGYSGGAIANNGTKSLDISNTIFFNNSATNYGGAIFNDNLVVFNLSSSKFLKNNAFYGGALYSSGSINNSISSSNFVNNTAEAYGGAFYNQDYNQIIINSNFSNNSATNYGGAIFNSGNNQNVINSTFDSNNAYDGGAIFNQGEYQNIIFSKFINNSAYYQGGAIFNVKNGQFINNSIFNNNQAYQDGGAIFIDGFNNSINNCNFTNNSANTRAGALYLNGINSTVINSIFKYNNANDGGAIYIKYNYDNIIGNVNNSSFINNSATYGGAIYNEGLQLIYARIAENIIDSYVLQQITDSIFINNSAEFGGAIYNFGYLNISKSNFTNNSANYSGGGIFNNKFLFVSANLMANNYALSIGNVIYNNGSLNVILSYLNNSTIPVYKKNNILFANLTDDMGNPVTGQNISFFVNGTFIGNSIANEGYAFINYYVTQNEGILVVDGGYTGHEDQNITIKDGSLLISKTNVLPVINLNKNKYWVNEILKGVFKVSNIGNGDGENLNATLTFPSNFKLYDFIVSKGQFDKSTGIWYIGDLAVNESASLFFIGSFKEKGQKTFRATLSGSDINNSSIQKTVFVYKKSPGPKPGPTPGPSPDPNPSPNHGASAGMKNTGMPIFALLLILITSSLAIRFKK